MLNAGIPPRGITHGNMLRIGNDVAIYMRNHENLPDEIDGIIKNPKVLIDGWGNKIIYSRIDNECFLLTSYGRDRKSGGMKQNADLILKMVPSYDSNGVINIYVPGILSTNYVN